MALLLLLPALVGVESAKYAEAVGAARKDSHAGGIPGRPREAEGVWQDGSLYVFGGFVDDERGRPWRKMGRRSFKYTPSVGSDGELAPEGNWTELAEMPIEGLTGNTHCGNAGANGKIWLSGGLAVPEGTTWGNDSVSTSYLLEYDVASDAWTELENVPYTLGGGGLAYLNGQLHVISGTKDVNDYRANTGAEPYLFLPHGPIEQDVHQHLVHTLWA